jgi:transcriptional regulator with XRE-family HTH domain
VPRNPQPDWILDQRRTIGRRIQDARLWANLTQQGLDEASGIDRVTIQRIENGTTDARLSWLLAIAHALDVPLADLIADPPE